MNNNSENIEILSCKEAAALFIPARTFVLNLNFGENYCSILEGMVLTYF